MNSSAYAVGVGSPMSSSLSGPSQSGPESNPDAETWGERVYAALPLFIVGGACAVGAAELYATGAVTAFGGNSSVYLRPWILLLALGITGISAGIVALFVQDELAPPAEAVAALPAPPPASPWDESTIEPEEPLIPRRRTWETGEEEPSDEGPPRPPPTDNVMLDQIDEIAEALRKNARRPPPE